MSKLIEQSKPWYLSKTILVQLLGGVGLIAGAFIPSVGQFIQSYFSEIGTGWVIVNTILRFVTKDKVSIG
jgi:hypothetical protein